MKIKIFCTSIEPYLLLNKLPNYIQPLGLGEKKFPSNWFNEKKGENIKNLNKYYGELTGFFWVWKNLSEQFKNNDYLGFCHYRKLWLNYLKSHKSFSINSIYTDLFNPQDHTFKYIDAIQVQPIIFNKKNLLEDFLLVHKSKMLIKSIDFLEQPIRNNFLDHLSQNILYPLNMFIVKKKYFIQYCNIIFPWLYKCYEECVKKNFLIQYNARLPAFLAERFTSFWFKQYSDKKLLSYARIGNFFLSEKINKFINPLKIPFTSKMYPTIHNY